MSLRLDRTAQPWQRQTALWTAPSFIESIQRGTINWNSALSATATISAVDPSRSRVRFLGSLVTADLRSIQPRIDLTNATTVTAFRGLAGGADGTVAAFEVVQYMPGIVRSIQRGTLALVGGTTNATITAVGSTLTTVVDDLGHTDLNPTPGVLTTTSIYLQLTTTTNVAITAAAIGSQVVGYQVTEWN